jgi:hypothetical protein
MERKMRGSRSNTSSQRCLKLGPGLQTLHVQAEALTGLA